MGLSKIKLANKKWKHEAKRKKVAYAKKQQALRADLKIRHARNAEKRRVENEQRIAETRLEV